MTRTNLTLAITLAAAVLLPAATASADIMQYDGMLLNESVKIYAPGMLAHNQVSPAGQLAISYQDTDYAAYCVDLNHYSGTTYVTERSVESLRNGALVALLIDTYAADVDTSIEAASLQTAIWEVIYERSDNPFDVTDGYLSIRQRHGAEAQVAAGANALLSTLVDNYQGGENLTVLDSRCKQDVIIQDIAIPEPCTTAMIVLGAFGFVLRHRRVQH